MKRVKKRSKDVKPLDLSKVKGGGVGTSPGPNMGVGTSP